MTAPTQFLARDFDTDAARDLRLDHKFTLGAEITDAQRAFLDIHGYLHFRGVLSQDEVGVMRDAQDELQAKMLAEDTREIHGIPLFFGEGTQGERIIQRIPFASLFSETVRELVLDARFDPIKEFVGGDVRCAHDEKDGVVMNRYVNTPGGARTNLGWHTDGLRDLFYLRMPQQMLNFGLHLDRITEADGGLRILPGTHKQGFFKMCFYKPYFVWHRPDKNEVMVDTEPGDLTIHDGRTWHRVAKSRSLGAERRSVFVPYMTGPVEPKAIASRTPLYHRLGRFLRRFKRGGG